ncbi:hypothetical protein [Terriglobus aquaticus]|uniref:hypothetical protein n=1 Tax=Terriglobus aquaticus TaxID=940139 RepID=UPI0021DF9D48|nr:hypothetical protein [Terriglobus aquaticus]
MDTNAVASRTALQNESLRGRFQVAKEDLQLAETTIGSTPNPALGGHVALFSHPMQNPFGDSTVLRKK